MRGGKCNFVTLFTWFALIGSSYAQIATTTSLVGTVTDSSGKIIAGAKITAVNAETLDTYNTISNQDGNYRIDFVRVGTYNVSAEYPGFTRLQHTGSIVSVNQIVRDHFGDRLFQVDCRSQLHLGARA